MGHGQIMGAFRGGIAPDNFLEIHIAPTSAHDGLLPQPLAESLAVPPETPQTE